MSRFTMWCTSRRAAVVLGLAGFCGGPALAADALGLDGPDEALTAMRKIQCSTADGLPVTYGWEGRVYSRVPGEPDRLLFKVEGMNIRQCGPLAAEEGGPGFKLVTREILLYLDPQTGEVLETWDNPWTGETVKVIHVTNDPVNQRIPRVGRSGREFALPFVVQGNQWWLTSTVPLFYKNVLGGEYQKYVGGTYHATEMFNFFGDVDEITDPDVESVPARVGWVRISSWLPWMEMGDRPGLLYFHTAGRKLDSFDDLSERMREQIANSYPEYANPPPLDDQRRNETSWTFFKKVLDAQ
ncbi:MAG: DUF1838 domain-containing protein [Chromatiales bacterium]|nr:MAG: DUF1838 domain-containing protein [Chromatiales bacterium]